MTFEAVPVKDIKRKRKKVWYFAILNNKYPWIVEWDGEWWLDILSRTKVYGITHILIKVND